MVVGIFVWEEKEMEHSVFDEGYFPMHRFFPVHANMYIYTQTVRHTDIYMREIHREK